jgi:hypothetical protein
MLEQEQDRELIPAPDLDQSLRLMERAPILLAPYTL